MWRDRPQTHCLGIKAMSNNAGLDWNRAKIPRKEGRNMKRTSHKKQIDNKERISNERFPEN